MPGRVFTLSLREKCPNRVFSVPYFPVFGLNAGKYRLEKIPYLNTFHAVSTEIIFKFFPLQI